MKEVKARKKRIVSYDVARALAIFLVVLCHATGLTYTLYFKQPELVGGVTKLVASALFSLGRLGVPIFLFLTGALVLRKQIESDDDVLTFYKKNLLPLIIVNTFWVVIYNIFFLLNGNIELVSAENIIKEVLFMKGVPIMNMWYIPMIVGMYIGLPFVAKIVKTFSEKSIYIGALIVFIACFIFPFINFILKTRGIEAEYYLSSVLDLSLLGGAYGLYILFGYWLTKKKEVRIKNRELIIGTVFSFLTVCAWQVFTRLRGSDPTQSIWYTCPFILVCCACLFVLVNRIDFSKMNKKVLAVVTFISKSSLAIFFIHVILQVILVKIIEPLQILMIVKFLLLFVVSAVVSILMCYLLSKSKFISKYVLLIKR